MEVRPEYHGGLGNGRCGCHGCLVCVSVFTVDNGLRGAVFIFYCSTKFRY